MPLGNLEEALKSQYVLRSIFLHRRLKQVDVGSLIKRVDALKSADLKWPLRKFRISKSAFGYLGKCGIMPHQVFCHPDVLLTNPTLVRYYRGIAGVSQKGIQKLACATKAAEEGLGKLSSDNVGRLTATLNSLISAIVDGDPDYRLEDERSLLLVAALGISLDGSWRTEIGTAATEQVQSLIWPCRQSNTESHAPYS